MTNALSFFLNYPQLLILTGTVVLILGLIGLALFIPSDVESTEYRLSEQPRLFHVDTSKEVGDPAAQLKVFAEAEAAETWIVENGS